MILLGMVACGGKKKNFRWEITQNIIKMGGEGGRGGEREKERRTLCIM